jgi:tripartite-type tricarboxylate transporter receptor subunit TctC
VADFYRGKQLSIIVGYGPGGGYDLYARLLARHISRHMPGTAEDIVEQIDLVANAPPDMLKQLEKLFEASRG